MSEYINPTDKPLTSSANAKPSSSLMERLPSGRLQGIRGDPSAVNCERRLENALAAILERDLHGHFDLVGAAVKGLNDIGIFVGDEAAADLAGAGHLGVVGLQFLIEQQEAANPGRPGKSRIDLGNFLRDELGDFGLAAQIHETRVGEAASLGPVPNHAEVDGDHRGDERASVAEGHGLANEWAELQLVLDELRREGRAVPKLAHVLGAVDDGELPLRIDEAGVAGLEPAICRGRLARRVVLLVVADENAWPAQVHLAFIVDADLPARRRLSNRVWI